METTIKEDLNRRIYEIKLRKDIGIYEIKLKERYRHI
jgi:hypothetical protein